MADRVWFKPKPGLRIPDGVGGIFPPEGAWTERNRYIVRRLMEKQKDGSVGAGEIYDRNPYEPEPEKSKPAPAPQSVTTHEKTPARESHEKTTKK